MRTGYRYINSEDLISSYKFYYSDYAFAGEIGMPLYPLFLFSEENIWQLCNAAAKTGSLDSMNVVFISNDQKAIPLWCQKASVNKDVPVVWDYHVILIAKTQQDCLVYDLDSTLPFPTQFPQYYDSTVRNDADLHNEYHRQFRVIPGDYYLKEFSSDRSHMKDSTGRWQQPPPFWAPIYNGVANNLNLFWTMKKSMPNTVVMDSTEFRQKFTS